MFWKKSHHEESRQKVVHELLSMDPAERRGRLDRAVAEGKVNADQVDSMLRLAERLEGLRNFTIHPDEAEAGAAPASDEVIPAGDGLLTGEAVVVPTPVAHRTPRNGPPRPRKKRVGAPVAPDPEQARRWLAAASMPLDALEAASRLVARDKAARKRRSAVASSPEPEAREVPEEEPPAQPEPAPSASIEIEPGEPTADENWPSISWLRP